MKGNGSFLCDILLLFHWRAREAMLVQSRLRTPVLPRNPEFGRQLLEIKGTTGNEMKVELDP